MYFHSLISQNLASRLNRPDHSWTPGWCHEQTSHWLRLPELLPEPPPWGSVTTWLCHVSRWRFWGGHLPHGSAGGSAAMVLCPGMARWSLPHYHTRDFENVSVLVCGQNQKGTWGGGGGGGSICSFCCNCCSDYFLIFKIDTLCWQAYSEEKHKKPKTMGKKEMILFGWKCWCWCQKPELSAKRWPTVTA